MEENIPPQQNEGEETPQEQQLEEQQPVESVEEQVPTSVSSSNTKLLVGIVIALVAIFAIGAGFYYLSDRGVFGPTGCTEELKICPGGSGVGRVPPMCEFEECPNVTAEVSIDDITFEEDQSMAEVAEPGVILVKKDSVLNQYAIELAQNRKWRLLEVTISDPEIIRNNIIQLYNDDTFNFLLILGDETQIPLYDKELLREYIISTGFGFNGGIMEKDKNDLDSLYYGNVDNDLYIELAVGRLPFTSENDLENYYSNLPNTKQIDRINVLSHLSFFIPHIGYLESQLASYVGAQYYMVDTISEFNEYLVSSDLLYSNNHGNQRGFAIGEYYTLQNIPTLDNKPIVVGDSCSAGAELGPEFLKKGAIAYIGYYVDAKVAGLAILDQPSNSRTIGELMREINNFYYFNQLINPGPRSTYYLIGDPFIKFELNSINKITFETENNQLKINIPPMKDYTFDIPGSGEVTNTYTQYTYQFSAFSSTINLLKSNPIYVQGNEILMNCNPDFETGSLLYCRDVSLDYPNSPYEFAAVIAGDDYNRFVVRLDNNYNLNKLYELKDGGLEELKNYIFETVNAEGVHYLIISEPSTIMFDNIHTGEAYEERTFVFDVT